MIKNSKIYQGVALGALALLTMWGCAFQSEQADMIIHNAQIVTLNAEGTIAEAVAIREGKILEVGAERYILNKYGSKNRIDARGGVLVPGLMDAHSHFVGYADGLLEANLTGTDSWVDVIDHVANHARTKPLKWIIGRGWDQNDWARSEFPTRHKLDSLFPNIPVVLERVDGHAVIVNGVALRMAALDCGVQIEGGEVICDANDWPTGVLVDAAASVVWAQVPVRDSLARLEALLEAQERLLEQGLTSITDAGLSWSEVERLRVLQESGILKIRISAMLSATDENIAWLINNGPVSTERLSARSVKFYMDGALGSRGATLLEPYSDRPGWHGLTKQDLDWFARTLEELESHNLQAATHCIGDSAVRMVLNAYAKILNGPNDKRWRIEHAQVVHPKDVSLFGANSIIPSIQPTHATSDMYWAGERLGRNRIRRAYAYKTLLGQLGMLALGTDFPVEDIDPRKTFYSAVARRDISGYPAEGYQMDQALSRESTLRGMTQWAALAQFQEASLGTIEPGKSADFTWMDRNWLDVPLDAILDTRIEGTCIAGEWVFLRNGKHL